MRRYTSIDRRAAIDARREAILHRPIEPRDDNRTTGRLLLDIGTQVIDLELRPDRRDVRRWYSYRNGQPFAHAGLERIWRMVQADIAPPIGRLHWC